jgi:hypothetical protein
MLSLGDTLPPKPMAKCGNFHITRPISGRTKCDYLHRDGGRPSVDQKKLVERLRINCKIYLVKIATWWNGTSRHRTHQAFLYHPLPTAFVLASPTYVFAHASLRVTPCATCIREINLATQSFVPRHKIATQEVHHCLNQRHAIK